MLLDKYPTWIIAPLFLFGLGAAISFAAWRSAEAPKFWRDFGAVGFWVCIAVCIAFMLFGWQDNAARAQSRILGGIESAAKEIGALTPDGQKALVYYLEFDFFPVEIQRAASPRTVEIGGEWYADDFLRRVLGPKHGQPYHRYPDLAGVSAFTRGSERAAWQRLRDWLVAADICQTWGNNRGITVLDGRDERLAETFGFSLVDWIENG
jgi:hypothetical protein